MNTALKLADRGWIPLPLLKLGVRRLCAQRLREESARATSSTDAWLAEMARGPIAAVPEKANEQHYEVQPAFFEAALGPRLKYSSCYFPQGDEDLAAGEDRMLEITVERARLADGQRILELGCGWGSLTLWMAEHFPNATIVGVSNSAPQRRFIESRAKQRGLTNVTIRTADMNTFDAQELAADSAPFDRIVSVEMFEHMRDWRTLLRRARRWLADDGKMFIHVFTHRTLSYPFEVRDSSDWMSATFFSGGMMPADDLLPALVGQDDVPFSVEEHDVIPGRHYARTAQLWRENIESRKAHVTAILERSYGDQAPAWFQRWRLFFLACEELFGYRGGSEWAVSHYRLAASPFSAPQGGADLSVPAQTAAPTPGVHEGQEVTT